jgi:hypothetical protein
MEYWNDEVRRKTKTLLFPIFQKITLRDNGVPQKDGKLQEFVGFWKFPG